MSAEVLNEDGLETDSFIYNPSFASSDFTSIASYKTERSINSRKSRYNALPRRKYAGIGQPRLPQGLVSEDVDSVPKVCRIIGRLIRATLAPLFRMSGRFQACSVQYRLPPKQISLRKADRIRVRDPSKYVGVLFMAFLSRYEVIACLALSKASHLSIPTYPHRTRPPSWSVRSTAGRARCYASPPHASRRYRKPY
jgi:hypothetical protein